MLFRSGIQIELQKCLNWRCDLGTHLKHIRDRVEDLIFYTKLKLFGIESLDHSVYLGCQAFQELTMSPPHPASFVHDMIFYAKLYWRAIKETQQSLDAFIEEVGPSLLDLKAKPCDNHSSGCSVRIKIWPWLCLTFKFGLKKTLLMSLLVTTVFKSGSKVNSSR